MKNAAWTKKPAIIEEGGQEVADYYWPLWHNSAFVPDPEVIMIRIPCRLHVAFACVVVLAAFSGNAFADGSHDRTQMGHSISIGPGEKVSDATCFGCSIHVRGQVEGDVTSFGGSIVLEDGAEVAGDATAFAGDVRLEKDVKVSGSVTVFGGRIHRDPGASVGGDITN